MIQFKQLILPNFLTLRQDQSVVIDCCLETCVEGLNVPKIISEEGALEPTIDSPVEFNLGCVMPESRSILQEVTSDTNVFKFVNVTVPHEQSESTTAGIYCCATINIFKLYHMF